MIAEATATDAVRVEAHTGLVADAAPPLCRLHRRGCGPGGDFEFELQMALTNESVTGIRTVFLPTAARFSFVSSVSSGRSCTTAAT